MPGRIFPMFHSSSSSETLSTLETKRRLSNESQRPAQLFLFHGVSRQMSNKPLTNPATISMTVESPPLVLYGQPKDSTGALLSGLLHLGVNEAALDIKSFEMVLVTEVATRKPVVAQCHECANRSEVIHKWSIISETRSLRHGTNSYPFSFHVPGHLPATNSNSLGNIRYLLIATALSSDGDEMKLERELTISRAILPGPDRHSIRIFPPTNLSASVELPNVVHPAGNFALSIRLDGVTCPQKETRWRVKKAKWKIDERSQVISPACTQHSSKLGGSGKGMLHEDIRVVGSGEVKAGWKSNYDRAGGQVEIEIMAGLPDGTCDVESECGVKVEHNMIVELVVAEEHCPKNSKVATPTGAARVLRMQFNLIVTARGGLGISWDEEQPPLYEDVPSPPPKYEQMTCGSPLDADLPPVYCEGIPVPPSPALLSF